MSVIYNYVTFYIYCNILFIFTYNKDAFFLIAR